MPHAPPSNLRFPRDGRCLLFARHSVTLRDCRACRTIAWCPHYDAAALRQPDRLALDRWETEGGTAPPP